jgi:diaminopimelate decarboxylase
MQTRLPFTKDQIAEINKEYPTPFYVYDEMGIRNQAKALQIAMSKASVPGFRNYFAVKALPNPSVLAILKDEDMGLDCSSLAELELAARVGVSGENIMFSSNNTPTAEFVRAQELGAIINFDDVNQVRPFLDEVGLPVVAACRYNPGDINFEGVNELLIGKPSEAKFGMPKDQIKAAYKVLQAAGARRFGLHTMLLSNELDWRNHIRIAELLFGLAKELHKELGIEFEFINLGGGLGVAYRPEQQAFELNTFASELRKLYDDCGLSQIGAPKIYMENGRWVTAESGYLVTKAVNRKDTHKRYVGVDASMSNLMRPGMYGAYHHITVLGKEKKALTEVVDVVGSLCENNDKFAIDRDLPVITQGDYLAIHTAGAHAHTMGFQYNGKLRSAELLLRTDGQVRLIRRAETLQDYFATLDGTGVEVV